MNDARPPKPELPYAELHAALGDDADAHEQLEQLRAHLDHPRPDPEKLRAHVDALRGVHDAEAHIVNWWDNPETQRWIMTITNAGL
jgi:hypothetical protein